MPRWPSIVLSLVTGLFAAACGGNGGSSSATTDAVDAGLTEATGCSLDKTAVPFTVGMNEAAESGVTVAIEASPPVPSPGDSNTWKLTVTDKAGAPVPSGTTVSVVCKMTHASGFSHGCPSTIQVKELSEGTYEAKPIIFNMQGHWQVTFQIGGTDEIPFQLCIE